MSQAAARIISLPQETPQVGPVTPTGGSEAASNQSDLFTLLLKEGDTRRLDQEQRRILGEITALRAENRWEDILAMFHPVEDKQPEMVALGLDLALRQELAFVLGQVNRHDEAIDQYRICLAVDNESFMLHSGMAYTLYDSLYAAKARLVTLHPAERKARIEKAHKHFQEAIRIRPRSVTNYYRQGMLYKQIQNKKEKALPLFEAAVANWRDYSPEERDARKQERKNYIKAMYNWASCLLDANRADQALKELRRCLDEDRESNYLLPVNKYFALGKVHFQRTELEPARKALEMAAGLAKPDSEDFVFELLARVHLAEGHLDKAWDQLQRVPQQRRRPYFRWTEADVLAGRGETQRAKKVLEQAAERDRKGRHKALLRLAKLEFRDGEYARCLQRAEEANTFFHNTYLNPNVDALIWKTGALLRLGRGDEARNSLDELTRRSPSHPYLPKLRGMLPQRAAANQGEPDIRQS